MTTDKNKISILADFYSKYRDDEEMEDFFDYNDLGLPMAYLVSEDLVSLKDKGNIYISETWALFLESLEIQDMGFENLEQVLSFAQKPE